jgi:hypothetical protein
VGGASWGRVYGRIESAWTPVNGATCSRSSRWVGMPRLCASAFRASLCARLVENFTWTLSFGLTSSIVRLGYGLGAEVFHTPVPAQAAAVSVNTGRLAKVNRCSAEGPGALAGARPGDLQVPLSGGAEVRGAGFLDRQERESGAAPGGRLSPSPALRWAHSLRRVIGTDPQERWRGER